MKRKLFAILGLILILGFTSCTKWIDPEINKDPDSPTQVPMDLILPSVQVNLGYVFGGFDVAGVTGIWMQYLKGTDRQALAIDGYNLTQTDVNNLWNDIYTGPLMDLKDIMNQATEAGADQYYAVAEILTAFTLGTMTGLFGDIPYSDALNGYPPVYDSEEQIYNTIQTLLDDAIAKIEANPNAALNNDMWFGGDLDLWKAAAYSLKARYAVRIANRVAPNWNDVISWVDQGLSSVGVSMYQFFTENATENNPMYQYVVQRSGYAEDNATFQGLLSDRNDPRAEVLYYGNDKDQGIYNLPNSPVVLYAWTEDLFIKAEAYYRMGDEANAKTALVNAVAASLSRYQALANELFGPDVTVYDEAWLTDYATNTVAPLTGNALLEEIMVQKYIDNFLNAESWADYRRTGYPKLNPVVGTELPHRYPYPTDEVSYNPNTPDYGTIFNPLWFEGAK